LSSLSKENRLWGPVDELVLTWG